MARNNNARTTGARSVTNIAAANGPVDAERLRIRLELRRSSASSRHVSARRKGSRQDNRRYAISNG